MRPIIIPATNTATMTKMSMLMKPTPTPPKMLFSHMPIIGIRPPSGVSESCIALTDPFDVTVVVTDQSADRPAPKRTSLPSIEPVDWSTPIAAIAGLPPASCATPKTTIGR